MLKDATKGFQLYPQGWTQERFDDFVNMLQDHKDSAINRIYYKFVGGNGHQIFTVSFETDKLASDFKSRIYAPGDDLKVDYSVSNPKEVRVLVMPDALGLFVDALNSVSGGRLANTLIMFEARSIKTSSPVEISNEQFTNALEFTERRLEESRAKFEGLKSWQAQEKYKTEIQTVSKIRDTLKELSDSTGSSMPETVKEIITEYIGVLERHKLDTPETLYDRLLPIENRLIERIASSPITEDDGKRVGGINLNPELLDLQIKRDGNGVPLPMNLQPIHRMKIDGFVPVIINVTPVVNLPLLLGFADSDKPFDSADANA
ncbi:MAG: hypothetical protein KAR31_08270, partial [Candidatus Omnitrophica bacterium]|nr:hypothetical protein [Candidatus Omnitrophota bacterium]